MLLYFFSFEACIMNVQRVEGEDILVHPGDRVIEILAQLENEENQ